LDPIMPVDVVALLSGGLDSAAYALDLASRGDQRMYLLSFHLDRHDEPRETVFKEAKRLAGSRVHHGWANPTVHWPKEEKSNRPKPSEYSNRSRGLLFATAGVLVAA